MAIAGGLDLKPQTKHNKAWKSLRTRAVSPEPLLLVEDVAYAKYNMSESFQDYSWIQDFDADFPKKVSLKILN